MNKRCQVFISAVWLSGALTLLACANASHPDHAESEPASAGSAETRLAGIELHGGGLKAIVAEYGNPTAQDGDLYCWESTQFKLCAEILRGTQYENGEYMQDVSVECGPCAERYPHARTSRGVGLGDPIKVAHEVYGSKFVDLKSVGLNGLEYRWGDGSALRFEARSEDQRIWKITLLAPE